MPSYRQVYQRDDRNRMQNSYSRRERGRSPGSRGSLSEGDRSPSPKSRSRGGGVGGYSSGSDTSEKSGKCTVSVKNIIARGSDSSLEESLYHEFKKYGEIMNIIIKGTGQERYAYVQFSKAEEAEDATRSSGKVFLGQEMKVAIKGVTKSRSSTVIEDLAFDPHATRTIFVGNLDKGMMHGELRDIFERFGEVVDVDIKKMQTGITTYAFVQFIDINGATLGKRKMDRQAIGNNRIKVGYGRGTPTNSLWVGNLPSKVSEHEITKSLNQFGYIQRCLIDKKIWQALVRFETIDACTKAFAEMHGKSFSGKRLAVDYASPACRNAFYNRMERHGFLDRRQLEPSPTPPDAHVNFQNAARGGPFQPRGNGPNGGNGGYSSSRDENKDDNRNDKYSDRFEKERERYRERGKGFSPMPHGSISPKRRSRESISPVRSERAESRSKRKLSVGKSPEAELDPPKKKEKKKKKEKTKRIKSIKEFSNGGDGVQKSKAELKKEKKEKKKAEKEKKKAEKKEKKLKVLRDLEEKRMSIEMQVKESSVEEQKSEMKEEDEREYEEIETSENDGISDVSQVAEEAPKTEVMSEISEGEGTVEPTIKTEDEQQLETNESIPADEKPADKAVKQDEIPSTQGDEVKKSPEKTNTPSSQPQQEQEDSSDSSTSSSSSSESDDSDDSSDDERNGDAKKLVKTRQERERPREPKAYRQGQEAERRESRERDKERDYSRSKYPDYYRSSSSKDGNRTRSPSHRALSRSRSPYRSEGSYDRRRGRSSSRGSPRYSRTDTRSDKFQKTPPPPPPHKDGRKENTSYPPATSSGGPSQSTDTLLDLLRRFPVMWQGLLGLKNDTAAVQMHFLSGNLHLAEQSLPRSAQPNEVPPPLRISQRMKLEPSQLEGVDNRIQQPKEHCMLLALPCGRDPLDVHAQTRALKTGFITYLQQKQAAGIINVPSPTTKQPVYVVHIFPPCEFAQSHLVRVAPDLLDSAVESGHLMVLITPL